MVSLASIALINVKSCEQPGFYQLKINLQIKHLTDWNWLLPAMNTCKKIQLDSRALKMVCMQFG